MASVLERRTKSRSPKMTLADLYEKFGPMPVETGGTVLPGFKVKVADIFAVLDEL